MTMPAQPPHGPVGGGVGGVHSRQCAVGPASVFPRNRSDIERLAANYYSYVSDRLFFICGRGQSGRVTLSCVGRALLSFELERVDLKANLSAIHYRIVGGLLNRRNRAGGTLSLSVEPIDADTCRLCVTVSGYQPRLNGRLGGIAFKHIQSPVHQWLSDGFVRWAAAGGGERD